MIAALSRAAPAVFFIRLADSGQMVCNELPVWRALCFCTEQFIMYLPDDEFSIIGVRPGERACQKQVHWVRFER